MIINYIEIQIQYDFNTNTRSDRSIINNKRNSKFARTILPFFDFCLLEESLCKFLNTCSRTHRNPHLHSSSSNFDSGKIFRSKESLARARSRMDWYKLESSRNPSCTYVVLIISRLKRTNQLFAAPLKIFLLSYLATPTAFYFSSRGGRGKGGGTNRQNEQRASITRHSCQLSEYRRLRKLLAPENWNLFSIKLNENIPTDCARPPPPTGENL